MEPLFTAEDIAREQEASMTGKFPVTKNIIEASKMEIIPSDTLDYINEIDTAYSEAVKQQNIIDYNLAEEAVKNGNATLAEIYAKEINDRTQKERDRTASEVEKIRAVSRNAIENIVASSPEVLVNNSPEKINQVVSTAHTNAAMEVVKEIAAHTAKKETLVKGVGFGFTPQSLFAGIAWDNVVEKVTGAKMGFWDTMQDVKNVLRLHYEMQPNEKAKADYIKLVYDNARSSRAISELEAGSEVLAMLGDEKDSEAWGYISKVLIGLGVVGVGASAAMGVRALRTANALRKASSAVELSKLGQKTLIAESTKQTVSGVGRVIGAATGLDAIPDLGGLAAGAASRILPDAITTATRDVKNTIMDAVDSAVFDIKNTVKDSNFREEELNMAIDAINQKYNRAVDPSIHSVSTRLADDGENVLATIHYGKYGTEQAAKEYAKLKDPTGERGLEVIPDITNNNFYVSETYIETLKKEREVLTAKLATADAPASLGELQKAQTSKPPDEFSLYLDKASKEDTDAFFADLRTKPNIRTYKNVSVSEEFDVPEVTEFIHRMNSLLGMDNQDIYVLSAKAHSWSSQPDARGLAAFYKGHNVIGMSVPMKNKKIFYTTLAHEYAHVFHNVWGGKYNKQLERAFKMWLSSRGIKVSKGVFAEPLSQKEFAEFRSLADWNNLEAYSKAQWPFLSPTERAQYKDPHGYLKGTMSTWYNSPAEFFAENFAKWAFTDEIPTTTLGRIFKELVDGLKAIAAQFTKTMKDKGISDFEDVNKNIKALLNNHAKYIQDNPHFVPPKGAGDQHSYHYSIRGHADRLEAVNAELDAIDAARTGLITGYLVREKITRPRILYSELGKFTEEDIRSALKFALGDWSLTTSRELYNNRLVSVHMESMLRKRFVGFVQKSTDKLSRKEKVHLEDILKQGDREQKEYDTAQLKGMGASNRTIEAYFAVRSSRNLLYAVRNSIAATSLTRKGYRYINTSLIDVGDGNKFARRIDASELRVKNKLVYNSAKNSRTRLSETADLDGQVLYEFEQPIKIGDNYHRLVLMDPSRVTESAITTVIPYRHGEYRRIYTDEYFIKIHSQAEVDGELIAKPITHRTSKTRAKADKYVAAFNDAVAEIKASGRVSDANFATLEAFGWNRAEFEESVNSGRWGADIKAQVVYDRNIDDYTSTEVHGSYRFSNERGERIISVDGADVENTLNPLDSVNAEIANTAHVAAITEWRDAAIYRWWNTFKDELPPQVKAMRPEEAIFWMANNKGHYTGTDRRVHFAQRVQDYVLHELGMPTAEEQRTFGLMKGTTEWLEQKAGGTALQGAVELTGAGFRQAGFVKWARTLTFHSMLGCFNPAQILVQGVNAINAASIHPVYGLKAFKRAALYRLALMSDNEDNWIKLAKVNKYTSLGLGDEDEFVETIRSIRRSGLLDSIGATSLYSAETGSMGLFNKWTRRAAGVSAAPFNRGEEFARLISYDIAKQEWMANNPGGVYFSDKAIKEILNRQDFFTQNLTKANTAYWQKGVFSIPMQFMQYNIKLGMNIIASLFGKERAFTRPEAIRLMMGHMFVYGVAGNSLFTSAGEGLLSLFGVETGIADALNKADLTPDQRLYIVQGIFAGLINDISQYTTGDPLRLAVGTRLNTFEAYREMLDSAFSGDANLWELVFGAFGGAFTRAGFGFTRALGLFAADTTISTEKLEQGMEFILAGLSTTTSNYYKGVVAEGVYNYITSRKGTPLYPITDKELWFQKYVGLPPASREDYDRLYKSREDWYNEVNKTSELLLSYQLKALVAFNKGDQATADQYYKIIQVYLVGIMNKDPLAADQIVKNMQVHYSSSKLSDMLTESLIKSSTLRKTPLVVGSDVSEVR